MLDRRVRSCICLPYQSKVAVQACDQGADWTKDANSNLKGITPQLYADNLKCTSYGADDLLETAQYTVNHVHAAGQEPSLRKCVLLNTSQRTRKRTKTWRDSNVGCSLAAKLEVRDFGGDLDVTHSSPSEHAGCSSKRCHVPGYFYWCPSRGVPANAWSGRCKISPCPTR